MASAISSATQSIASLLKQTHLDDHEEVLRATNVALKKSKSDIDSQHVKVVALLKLDRYDDAVELLEGGGDKLKERASLERAYALYKVGRLEEAAQIASREESRGMKHVEAQATYRLENSERAAQLYKQLSRDLSNLEHEENDLRINSGAVDAQLEWTGKGRHVGKKKVAREDLEAFDTAYNAACGSIARRELAEGEVLLKRATDLCNASQDLSEDEKTAELLPILAQRIYVLSKLGKAASAQEVAKDLFIENIPDLATRQIAQNNSILTSANTSNPYMAHRVFHSTPEIPATSSPFSFQTTVLRRNAYILDLLSLKYSGVSTSTLTFLSKHPSPSVSSYVNGISVLNAAAVAKDATGTGALKVIKPLLQRRPTDVGLILLITQLYILAKDTTSAVQTLESFQNHLASSSTPEEKAIAHNPGLIAVLSSIYRLRGQTSHVRGILAKAAAYWRNRPDAPPSLLRAAALSLLESNNPSDLELAGEIFSALLNEDANDKISIAGYIAAYASTSPSKIKESQLEKLTAVSRLTSGINAAALEGAGIPRLPTVTAPATRKRPAEEAAAQKPVKKRVRKSRLPKDYDTSKTPDPERWLPLRERSTYRPKGKKGKQKAAALTQGGVVTETDTAEVVSGAGKGEKVAGGGGGAKGAKKKKKGGKR